MKKIIKYAATIVLLTSLITGCSSPPAKEEVDSDPKIPVKLETMKVDTIERTYVAIGEIVPENQVDLFVNGSGYIEKISVNTGDKVEKGDLVLQLDDNDAGNATYTSTESSLRTLRDDLKDQLDSARENLTTQKILYEEDIISKADFESVELQLSSLERQYNNAVVSYNNELAALNDSLKDSVKNRTIYSPINGILAAIYVKEGQAVGNQMALSIVDDSSLYVKTYISSDLKKLVDTGDFAYVKLDGNEDNIQKGCINQINELPDMNTKLFEALICIEDFSQYIIGDFAEVEFVIDRYEALMIPTRSIIRSGVNEYIYTYKDGILEKILIETGQTKDEWIELKGYEHNPTQVVVKGQNQLNDDSQILIVE
jgi:RND family efflux transporter MFP subunit